MAIYSYLRVSTKKQDVAMQREFIAQRGVTIPDGNEYVDMAISGTTEAQERKGYTSMLDRLQAGDVVYVYALDRLGRNAADLSNTIQTLDSMGVYVMLLKEGLSTEGAMGKCICNILGALAQMVREGIVERVRDGMQKESTKKRLLERPSSINKQRVIEAIKDLHNTQGRLSINKTREGLTLTGIHQSRAAIAEYISTIYN